MKQKQRHGNIYFVLIGPKQSWGGVISALLLVQRVTVGGVISVLIGPEKMLAALSPLIGLNLQGVESRGGKTDKCNDKSHRGWGPRGGVSVGGITGGVVTAGFRYRICQG